MNTIRISITVLLSACLICLVMAFALPGKVKWDYDASCGGFLDKGFVKAEVTGTFKDQKLLDEFLKKCAVHAVIFRGLAPSKTNNCTYQMAICQDPGAETTHKDYFKDFFKDFATYKNYVTVDKANSGSEMFVQGLGYKKTMVITVDKNRLQEDLVAAGICK